MHEISRVYKLNQISQMETNEQARAFKALCQTIVDQQQAEVEDGIPQPALMPNIKELLRKLNYYLPIKSEDE